MNRAVGPGLLGLALLALTGSALPPLLAEERTLAVELGSIEHTVVGGRVGIERPRRFRDRDYTKEHPGGVVETYALTQASYNPRERYTRLTPSVERLSIEITDTRDVVLVREPLERSTRPRMEYRQPPHGPIRLTFTSPAGRFEFEADSLWRLYLAQPAACEEDLFPALERLRDDWRLADQGRAVLAGLLERASKRNTVGTVALRPAIARPMAADVPSEDQVATWIEQLDAPHVQTRREAALALRREAVTGRVDVSVLLTEGELSRSQAAALRAIETQALRRPADRPADVAAELANDPTVWLTLLTNPQASVRSVVSTELEHLSQTHPALRQFASRPARPDELIQLGRQLRLTR